VSKPYQPIDKGYPAPGLIAHVATSKFDWHLPLYRQERIYRSQGAPIARSSMCRLLKGGADELSVIVKRMYELILLSRAVQSDDTTMPVIKKVMRDQSLSDHKSFSFSDVSRSRTPHRY
jgi:transposase